MTTQTPQHAAQPIAWQAWAKAFILLGMGVYLLMLLLTGRITNYINTSFQWLTVVGTCLFLLMGVWQVYLMLTRQDDHHHHDHDHHDHHHHDHDHHDHHHHDHSEISWGMIAITAIPLLFGTLVPSQPLGANAVTGGVSLQPIGVGDIASFSKSPLERHILDWLREFAAVNNPSALDGQPVDLIGFVYREPFMGDDAFMVARFTLSCCVADAFAIGIPVIYEGAQDFQTGVWVRVQGTLQAGEFDGELVPIIHPTRVDETEQPERPYLYS